MRVRPKCDPHHVNKLPALTGRDWKRLACSAGTIDQVRQIDVDQYKYGFETVIESATAPKGRAPKTRSDDSARRTTPAWMLEWVLTRSALADAGRAQLGARRLPKIDFQTSTIIPPEKAALARSRRRDRSETACASYEKLGIPLASRNPCRLQQSKIDRSRPRVRFRLGGHHLQKKETGPGRR